MWFFKKKSKHLTYLERVRKENTIANNIQRMPSKSPAPIEIVQTLIAQHGINIYRWQRECWRCGKTTPIFSYYLDYDIEKLNSSILFCGSIGLGDITYLDQMLENEISSIKKCYSRSTDSSYTANSCIYCNALQGYNYIVEDPEEIFNDLANNNMKKYLYKTIYLKDLNSIISDLQKFLPDSM